MLEVASVCGMPLYFLILPMVCGNQQNLEARFQFFFFNFGNVYNFFNALAQLYNFPTNSTEQ